MIANNHFLRTLACSSYLLNICVESKNKKHGVESYYVCNNAIDYQDYWAGAASPPPKNATNVEGCGCYIVKEKDESDRAWVKYTTYYTYYYLCKNHMSEYREHNLSKKKDWKFSKNLRQRFSVEQGFIKVNVSQGISSGFSLIKPSHHIFLITIERSWKSSRKVCLFCATTVQICAAASEHIYFCVCGCFWEYFNFFKEREAASERY